MERSPQVEVNHVVAWVRQQQVRCHGKHRLERLEVVQHGWAVVVAVSTDDMVILHCGALMPHYLMRQSKY